MTNTRPGAFDLDLETLREQPYDVEKALRQFEDANGAAGS